MLLFKGKGAYDSCFNSNACLFVRNGVQMKKIGFIATKEYCDWYESQTLKVRSQIDSRLEKIREFGHYGHIKKLSSVLFEIKFNNGNRIYFTEKIIHEETLILILGGNKNGQEKDIKKAQKEAEKVHCD